MSRWTNNPFAAFLVGLLLAALCAGAPAVALEEINYLHLEVDARDKVDFASAEFAARLDRDAVPAGTAFGNIRIGGGLARDAAGILALTRPQGPLRIMPFQYHRHRAQTRLTALAAGEGPGPYGMGKAPIAFLFTQGVCAVGFEVSYYHSASENRQLPLDQRYEIRVTAYDRAGAIAGEYVRHPARGTTRQAFAVSPGAPPIAGIVFTTTAPKGFGLATLLAKPCALAMM